MGLIRENLPKVLDPVPGGKSIVNAVDFVVNWARANSLWPLVYGTSCCAIEMMAAGSSKYDWARFGTEVARATPRQADLIILAGTIVEKMAPRLRTLYDQMASPKYVIAMGACTISGGPFYYDSYYVVKGADRIIPVDVFVPGCPPRPEALLYGIMELQAKIKGERLREPQKEEVIETSPWVDKHSEAAKQWQEEQKVYLEQSQEARDKFKEENPDYKAYKHKKVNKETFDEVERSDQRELGLSHSKIYDCIIEKFPNLKLQNFEVVDEASLQAIRHEDTLDFIVDKEQYSSLINFLKTHPQLNFDFLLQVSAIDWENHIDIIVHLLSTSFGHKVFIRCPISREHAEIDSLCTYYEGANWHEREVYDFFGVHFKGHPDLRRLFLTEDFEGYPLRKDFQSDKMIKRPY